MKIDFKKSFAKDLINIKVKRINKKVKDIIEEVEKASSLMKIRNMRQLKSGSKYYRIKLGDYRIGIKFEEDFVVFVRILHRKEIYRYFPP